MCKDRACAAATSSDGVKNGDETDVDCGGTSAPRCALGRACSSAGDCVTELQCSNGTCELPACVNGSKDATEADVDCGAGCAAKCSDGKSCKLDGDCKSGVCKDDRCQVPSCTDLRKNGTETDVDCGGGCPTKCGVSQYSSGNRHAAIVCPPEGCNGSDSGHIAVQQWCCGGPTEGFWFNGTPRFTGGYYAGAGWAR